MRARATEAVRAAGETVRVLVDGREAAATGWGEVALVPVPAGRCAVVRAMVEEGFSAPIYVNCPFAERLDVALAKQGDRRARPAEASASPQSAL